MGQYFEMSSTYLPVNWGSKSFDFTDAHSSSVFMAKSPPPAHSSQWALVYNLNQLYGYVPGGGESSTSSSNPNIAGKSQGEIAMLNIPARNLRRRHGLVKYSISSKRSINQAGCFKNKNRRF